MSTYSSNLRIELIGTGDQAGNWGNTTNDNLSTILETAIAGRVSVTVTSTNQALTYVNGPTATSSANQAVRAIVTLNSSLTSAFNVYVPPVSKLYVINNASSRDATIYCSTVIGNTTAAGYGVVVPALQTMAIYATGTHVYAQTSYMDSPTLETPTITNPTISTGTFTTPTITTPAITTSRIYSSRDLIAPVDSSPLTTADDYMFNGGVFKIYTVGTTDFTQFGAASNTVGEVFTCTLPASPVFGTGTVTNLTEGSLIWDSDDDEMTVGTGSERLILADTSTAQSISNKTISDATLTTGNSIQALLEKATITASAPSSTTYFDVLTQAVQYYTSNASANFTLTVRGNSSTTLTSIMSTGQAITIGLLVTVGSTAYIPSTFKVDSTTITPKWVNGITPSTAYTSGVIAYTYTIIKTGTSSFVVLGSQTKFA